MATSVVLDTNVLLVSLSDRSRYHPIFRAFQEEVYTLCVATDIMLEYEEIVGRHMGRATARELTEVLSIAPNVRWVERYYRWGLIEADPDDDKFVDCAVAGQATFLVSNDRHFDVLRGIPFPKLPVMSADGFLEWLAAKSA